MSKKDTGETGMTLDERVANYQANDDAYNITAVLKTLLDDLIADRERISEDNAALKKKLERAKDTLNGYANNYGEFPYDNNQLAEEALKELEEE